MPYQKNVAPRRQGSGKKEKEKKSKDRREIFGNLFFFLSFFLFSMPRFVERPIIPT